MRLFRRQKRVRRCPRGWERERERRTSTHSNVSTAPITPTNTGNHILFPSTHPHTHAGPSSQSHPQTNPPLRSSPFVPFDSHFDAWTLKMLGTLVQKSSFIHFVFRRLRSGHGFAEHDIPSHSEIATSIPYGYLRWLYFQARLVRIRLF